MPAAGRLGDRASAPPHPHGCPGCPHPALGPSILGSPTVLINGMPALRVRDLGTHAACCGVNLWEAAMGSTTVYINNLAAYRLGDVSKHCGFAPGNLIEGSPDVLVGG